MMLQRSEVGRLHSRVRGRAALTRRLSALVLATHRYGRARAATAEDVAWCARVIDALTIALDVRTDGETRA